MFKGTTESAAVIPVRSINNPNPAWNLLLLPHPSVVFPVGPTHQVKAPHLLSSTCRLLLPNIWKVRAALRKLGSWLGKVGVRKEKRMWVWEVCARVQSGSWGLGLEGYGAWERVVPEGTKMWFLVIIDLDSWKYLDSSRGFILLYFQICRRCSF